MSQDPDVLVVRPVVRWWHAVVFMSVFRVEWTARLHKLARESLTVAGAGAVAAGGRYLLTGQGVSGPLLLGTSAVVLGALVLARLGEPLYAWLTQRNDLRVGSSDVWTFDTWGGRRSDGRVEVGFSWGLTPRVDVVAGVLCVQYGDAASAGFGADALPEGGADRLRAWRSAAPRGDDATLDGPGALPIPLVREPERGALALGSDTASWGGPAWADAPVLVRLVHLRRAERRALRRRIRTAAPVLWPTDETVVLDERGVRAVHPLWFVEATWQGVRRVHVTADYVSVGLRGSGGKPRWLSREEMSLQDVDRIVGWARAAGVRVTGRSGMIATA